MDVVCPPYEKGYRRVRRRELTQIPPDPVRRAVLLARLDGSDVKCRPLGGRLPGHERVSEEQHHSHSGHRDPGPVHHIY
jgi:hypothetical protein